MPEFLLLVEMPLTGSGKIIKRELVRWVAEGRCSRCRCATRYALTGTANSSVK